MNLSFTTFCMADVSDRHTRAQDRALLTRLADRIQRPHDDVLSRVQLELMGVSVIEGHTEGWFIAIGGDFSPDDRPNLLEAGFSKEFAALVIQLTAREITYVRLHDEGYEVEGLPLLD